MVRHHCHAVRCKVPCAPEFLMCPRHWRMVPKGLASAVWQHYRKGQCDDKRPSREWLIAANAAIEAVAAMENIPRGVVLAAEHIPNGLLCGACGKPQFETFSGDVCENGHGGAPGLPPGAWEPPPPPPPRPPDVEGPSDAWEESAAEPDPGEIEEARPLLYNDRFWRAVRQLEQGLEREVEENPYGVLYRSSPTVELDPDAFDYLVLRECGIEPTDPRRLEFIVWMVLDQSRRDGHTVVATEDILGAVQRRGMVERARAIELAKGLVERGVVTPRRGGDGESFLALGTIDESEQAVASFLAARIKKPAETSPAE